MPGYIIIKSLKKKHKEKSWKPPETNVLLGVNSKTITVTACFSLKIMNSRKKHFSSAERKKAVTKNSIFSKTMFQGQRWNKGILRRESKEFVASRPALQEILMEVLQAESKCLQMAIQTHIHPQNSTRKGVYIIIKDSIIVNFCSFLWTDFFKCIK